MDPLAFQKRYRALKAKMAPLRLREDVEIEKTLATIDALADRADAFNRGSAAGVPLGDGRWSSPPGLTEEPMMAKAEGYLDALLRGEYPLLGSFTEPGHTFVDHSFIEKDGVLHVFYNRGRIGYDWPEISHDTIGHAWTTDLIHWEYGKPAISVTDAPCQSFGVWAPAVIEHEGKYWMFYTGVNDVVAQSVCAAVSDDLYHWVPLPENPLYTPGDWCPWDWSHWSDCRDCFLFRDEGIWYLYFCTARYTANGGAEPASGIIRSTDLLHWEEVTTFRMPTCSHAAESPFVLKKDGRYYFFYTNCGHGTSYAISDNPVDGWQEIGLVMGVDEPPADTAWVPSCAEVIRYKGKWFISCCTRQPGWEQYLELFELIWNEDGTLTVGEKITTPW